MTRSFGTSIAISITSMFLTVQSVSAANVLQAQLGACPDGDDDVEILSLDLVEVPEPRIEELGPLKLVGFEVSTSGHKSEFFADIMKSSEKLVAAIPNIEQMSNSLPTIANVQGNYTIEACYTVSGREGFSYMPAVEVSAFDSTSDEFTGVMIPAARYAVFTYNGPAANGTAAFRRSIVKNYWPTAPYKRLDRPNLEIYRPDFDPSAEKAGVEVWVAIE